jgi:3,4-dihydroxy 2-butanone 4-phosphate synthase / GTP cyclohydrolase II
MNTNLYACLDDICAGRPIILVDSMERENEGDLMIGADFATVENIAFMARYGRGIMCVPCAGHVLDLLKIPMMVPPDKATDPFKTPFTVSVDARHGITTGVSAADRVETIKILNCPLSGPNELVRPGHLFPLRARDNLLRERCGHTEGSVTLMRMLDRYPVAVIVEIMNDDGTMARMNDLEKMAVQHSLNILSIEEIVDVAILSI